jgi:large subunit ribosomal protein L37
LFLFFYLNEQKDVIDLPEPLTINAIQTDSRNFSYGCLQLHSLNLDGDDAAARNVAWLQEPQSLFLKCDYVDGKPVLEGYNPKVFETLLAMYSSSISN